MTHENNDTRLDAEMELLSKNSFDAYAHVLRILLNEAMKIERKHALNALLYQRIPERKGYANSYKPKTMDTRMGQITVGASQVCGDVQFYPSALERGCRSEQVLKVSIVQMYVKGISTHKVNDVL